MPGCAGLQAMPSPWAMYLPASLLTGSFKLFFFPLWAELLPDPLSTVLNFFRNRIWDAMGNFSYPYCTPLSTMHLNRDASILASCTPQAYWPPSCSSKQILPVHSLTTILAPPPPSKSFKRRSLRLEVEFFNFFFFFWVIRGLTCSPFIKALRKYLQYS